MKDILYSAHTHIGPNCAFLPVSMFGGEEVCSLSSNIIVYKLMLYCIEELIRGDVFRLFTLYAVWRATAAAAR